MGTEEDEEDGGADDGQGLVSRRQSAASVRVG